MLDVCVAGWLHLYLQAPRHGLSKRGGGAGGGAAGRGGFVPPFVAKGIEHQTGGGGGAGGSGAHAGAAGGEEKESPFSPRTLEMLGGTAGWGLHSVNT
jgi:hypothetical protein